MPVINKVICMCAQLDTLGRGRVKKVGTMLLVIFLLGLAMAPLVAVPIKRNIGLTSPTRYNVSGRVVLSTVHDGFQRVFRFFNEVGGEVNVNQGLDSQEADGMVQVRFPVNDSSTQTDHIMVMSPSFVQKLHQLGATPIASIKVENLTGLRGNNVAVGHTVQGRLLGRMRVLGVVRDLDVTVNITRYDTNTYIVEPVEGLTYSMEELGVSEEVAYLMETDPFSMEDLLRFYFKFVLEATK